MTDMSFKHIGHSRARLICSERAAISAVSDGSVVHATGGGGATIRAVAVAALAFGSVAGTSAKVAIQSTTEVAQSIADTVVIITTAAITMVVAMW